MKKIFTIISISGIFLFISGCGHQQNEQTQNQTTEQTNQTTENQQ